MGKNIFTPLLNKKTIVFLIIFLYLIPTFFQFQFTEANEITGVYFGLPVMQSGDEPHYYAVLYSMVNDHDFYMTNNYNNAFYNNGNDLGTKKLPSSDRHTRLYDSQERTVTNIPFIDETHLDLRTIPGENSVIKEIPGHPLGVPFFAFLFLWPLKNTAFLEHIAILLTLTFSLIGIYFFYKILLHYHTDEKKALLYTFILACATQYWYYSKTFWAEPYLASFVIISWYYLVVRKTQWSSCVAGILLGFGFLMKYPFALVILLFFFWCFFRCFSPVEGERKNAIKNSVFFCIPLLLSLGSVFWLNLFLTGSIFGFNQAEAVSFVLPFGAMFRWLFDPTFGLVVFSPVLVYFLFGIRTFWKKSNIDAAVLLASFFFYFLFWASYVVSQYGGGGYSARYLLPVLPFLVLFCSFSNVEKSENLWLRFLFYSLLHLSFIINLLAAFAYPAFAGYALSTSLEKIFQFMIR